MNLKERTLILIHLIFFAAIIAPAQDFSYKMFTIKDGLSGSQISNVFFDHRGYLWVSTEGGLSRYDGSAFKNYSISSGLPDYYSVFDFEDSIGQIWLHCKDSVSVFDGIRFINYPIENPTEKKWITQVLCTSSGKKWFVTGNKVYEFQNGAWKKNDLVPVQPRTFFNFILELNDHSFLINCLDSLIIRFPNGNCRTIAYPVYKDQIFRGIVFTGGNYYVITFNHLYILRNSQLELVHDDVLANMLLTTVFIDREHRLWVGTLKHGIYVFSGDEHTQINPINMDAPDKAIYSIWNFCEDHEGNIWAATTSGLMKLSPSWVEFYDLPNEQKGVRSSFKDQDGTLYLGRTVHGFMVRKGKTFISSDSLLDNSSAKMVGNWIQGFASDEQKRLWLTDNNGSLLKISEKHAENIGNKLRLSLLTNGNQIIFNPSDSTVYVSSAHGLIAIRNDQAHEDTLFNEGQDRINTLSLDSTGSIWMGTEKAKIFQKRGNKIFLINPELKLDKANISKIKCPGANELWVGTRGEGIYKFHRTQSGSFVKDFHITSSEGLPNDNVSDFTFDKHGKAWIITLAGLVSVQLYTNNSKQNFAITKYGEEDGFRTAFFLYSSLVNDDSGNIWLATENYIAKIHSSDVVNDNIPPIVHVENVKLFNSNTEWGRYSSGFSSFFHLPINPVMPYNQNDIAIDYKAIGFNDPRNITYSYKLENLDKEWNSNGSNTHVTFGNLSPGNYVFKVRAKKPLSAWSPEEAQFAFVIKPPWWATLWSKAIIAALLISIIYLIYKIRLKQMLAKSTFEKQISEVEMKALRSQMNPHFIFNSLNSIHRFIQMNNSSDASDYLIRFSKLMRLILENSRYTEVPLEKDIEALRLYMELESARMNHKFIFEIKAGEGLDKENTMIPPLILQPFVENAIWHGMMNKEDKGKITVSINKENDMVSCLVEDDGIGREKAMQLKSMLPKDKQESLGMKLTHDRINIINSIKKTKAYIAFTDLYDESKNPVGTKVEVRLPLELRF